MRLFVFKRVSIEGKTPIETKNRFRWILDSKSNRKNRIFRRLPTNKYSSLQLLLCTIRRNWIPIFEDVKNFKHFLISFRRYRRFRYPYFFVCLAFFHSKRLISSSTVRPMMNILDIFLVAVHSNRSKCALKSSKMTVKPHR